MIAPAVAEALAAIPQAAPVTPYWLAKNDTSASDTSELITPQATNAFPLFSAFRSRTKPAAREAAI
jgi:hypothetical protein